MIAILRRARRTTSTNRNLAPRWSSLLLPLLLALSLFSSAAQAQVDVTATAGTPGPTTYATLKLAFDAINAGTHQGDIVASITANTTEGATSAVLNSSGAGSASYTSVLIQPTADGLSVTGNPPTGRGVIELNGADNVTIDGDNPGTGGTNRNLTIQNSAVATTTYTSVVRVALSTLITSANNVAVKNSILLGSATGRNTGAATSSTGSENTTYGILVGGGASTVAATTAPSAIASVSTLIGSPITATGFTADNNQIDACARGIAVQGSAITVASGLTITNNVIGSATAGNTTTVYSRGMTLQGFDSTTISGNTVRNIESFLSTAVVGLNLGDASTTGTNASVTKNIVTNVLNRSTGTFGAYGINLNAGNAITVANNFVAGVTHDMTGGGAFSTTFGVIGIRLGTGINHKVYYNSVSLFGLQPGTAATSLLSAALAVVATGQTGLDIRNNALSNTTTGGTTSIAHVAMYLPSGGTSAMNLTLNNNGYYYGTDVARQGVGQGGATAGTNFFTTLTALKAYSSALSVAGTNDNASFASTLTAPFTSATDLHIPAATPTQLESTGAVVSVTTDIDGDPRSGTTPDIGADEFAGVFVDLTPPAISYSALLNTSSTANRALSTTITDAGSGVPTAGVGLPVAYIRKGISDPFVASACSFAGGSTYTCTLDYSLVTGGSVVAGDIIQYYIAAQDTVDNVTTNPATGAGGFTANPPAAATPPTTPASYFIASPISGGLSVGTGGSYPSLTNAGGLFEAINNNVLTGNVTIDILSDLTLETGAVALNQWTEEGAGSYTLLLRPSGAPRVISGTSLVGNTGLIVLNGADRVTIDGSTSGGTDRSLTVTNLNTAGVVFWIRSASAANGASNNTVKNCLISGNSGTTTIGGVLAGGLTFGTAADAPNSDNTLRNNVVTKVQNAAFISGNVASKDVNWQVIGNTFGSAAVAEKLGFRGMLIGSAQNFTISENTILGVISTTGSSSTMQGIQIAFANSGGTISRNDISDIKQTNTSGWGSAGIYLGSSNTGANITVRNNFIRDVASQGFGGVTDQDNGYGLVVAAGSGYNVYANTILLTTDQGAGAAAGITAGINVLAAVTAPGAVDLRDNILGSTQTLGTRYGVLSSAPATVFVNINYNDYFAQNVGFLGGAQATLGAWQTATGQDLNSLAVDPLVVSATDLHLQPTSPMLNAGVPLAGVTVDFDNDPRPLTTPDIGADELVAGILAFSSATYADGESAGTTTITVNRTGGSAGSVSVDYATVGGGSATGGAACGGTVDFVNTSGTLTFGDTVTSQTFTVTLCPDALNEANETVNLALSNPLGGSTLGTPITAVLTINDDDPAPTISITDVTQNELNASTSTFGFVVNLSAPSGQTVTVHYQTADGTATAPSDYVAIPDTILTFNPGVTTGNVDVTVNGDTTPEGNETFFVNLATATNATILDNQGVGTITNDDTATGPVTVTATAGTLGPTDYATLKLAFDAINAGTHQGAIAIDINGDTTETATASLNNSGAGAAVYTSVVITPSGGLRTISGNIIGAIVKLNAADNVTIDGRIAGSGRNLAVLNSGNATGSAAVWLSSLGAGNGASNNVVRNLELACGVTNTNANSTFGIIMSGAAITTTSNGDDNDNNQFLFNRVIRARYGIVTRGVTTNLNIAPIVTDNIVGPASFGPDQIGKTGIFMQADTGAIVSRNTVQFVGGNLANTTAGADRLGIAIGSDAWSTTASTTLTSNTYTVTRNVIHDVVEERTFSAVGIESATTGGGSATNNLIANNFIYNVRSNGTTGDQVVGIGIAGGHTDQVVYNSISLTGDMDPGAAALSTNFGSAIRMPNLNGASHANLTLVGNSIYLDASASTATTHFYAITANAAAYSFGTGAENYNNLYINAVNPQLRTGGFAAASGAAATTEFATLANWQVAYTAPQDANSIQANPNHASPTADLHLIGTSPNINAGTTLAGVTVDIDNEVRPNGIAYDIGADEFYPQPGVLQLSSATYTGNEGATLVATVNRVAGSSGIVGATYTLTDGSATGGAACGAGVDYVNPGPQFLVFGDTVTSQPINVTLCSDVVLDAAETFTITLSLPTGGATLGSPTAATATIVDVAPPFGGPYTVGSGGNYPSLTNPGGIFEAINLSGASGNITIGITSDLTGETGAVPLNEIAGGFTVVIKPSGVARAITGSSATSLIKLAGVDNVTIDGSLAAGTDRSLSINNAGAGAIVWIATNGTGGATNDTIKNCNLTGPGAFAGQGIIAGSGATFGAAAEFPNSNNTIQNNAIKSVQNAAFISGEATTLDQNWLLTQNDVGSATAAEKLAFRGFLIGNAGNFTISRNVIFGVSSSTASSSTMSGIQVAANINGGSITGNRISNIRQNNTAGWGSNGILLGAATTASNVTISNNFISDIASQGFADVTALDNGYGIMVNSGGGYSIVANSILLNSDQVAVGSITAAVNIAAAVTTPASIELRDNILASTQTIGTRYGVLDSSTAGAAIFSTINHNDYFAQNVGFLTSAQATLANWQAATGQDANSLTVDPLFVTVPAPADLHLGVTSPMLNAGVSLAAVTVDIDNDPRPPATPDIGADEIVQADLSITKTDGITVVAPGGSTTYTIVAANAGAHNVTGATVGDTIPAFLTCNWTCSGAGGGACTAAGSGNINDSVNLPAGGSVTYTLSCSVSLSATGSILNTATVSSAIADPNAGNNSATDTDTVNASSAELSIAKSDGSPTEIPGTTVTYQIVALNSGPDAVSGATVVDNFAGILSGCSTSCVGTGGGSCTAGPVSGNLNDTAVNLPVGASVTYTATCNIAANATGTLVNTATVSSSIFDPNPANNTSTDTDTLVPTANLSITKTNGVTTVSPGQNTTYTIVAANAGPSNAPPATVADTFPAACTSANWTCVGSSGGTCTAAGSGNINESVGLPVGGSVTFTAVCAVSPSATGTLSNTATVSSAAVDPNTANNSATDTDTISNVIFIDGFETGDTSLWSVSVPLTFEAYATVDVAAGDSEAGFGYDFAAVQSGEVLAPASIAFVTDGAGKPLFLIAARRTDANGSLELTLEVVGGGRSSWVAVGEVGQQVRIEWSVADQNNLGHVAVSLDGRLALWVEGYAGSATPAGVKLLRAPAPLAPMAP
ncbi:MAG: Calx-beta domain-containing protein [Thermoanaerobaculia bacterium]